MSRPPSDATIIRTLRAEVKHERALKEKIAIELCALRPRVKQAEQEAAEWKERFDILLRREPSIGEPKP